VPLARLPEADALVLVPPLQIEKTLAKLKEFKAVEAVDDRKAAWNKFVQRQKVRHVMVAWSGDRFSVADPLRYPSFPRCQEKLRERDQTPSSSSRDHRSYGRERDYGSRSGERERLASRELNYSDRTGGSRSRLSGVDDERDRSTRRESRDERERDRPTDEREAKVRRSPTATKTTTASAARLSSGPTSGADDAFSGWASRHWQRAKGEPSAADLEEGEI
jgi:hypothetical protein